MTGGHIIQPTIAVLLPTIHPTIAILLPKKEIESTLFQDSPFKAAEF